MKQRFRRWTAGSMLLLFTVTARLSVSAESAVSLSLSAESAILMEWSTGTVLYEKAADTPRPMASTTKLMTALIAAETLDLEQRVAVPESAVRVEGSAVGLRAGDTLTVYDLLVGLLLASGNDAAGVIALTVSDDFPSFAARMNERGKQLGMTNTVFGTPSGLDEGDHHSTARDMARLAAAVLSNETLSRICPMKSAIITVSGRKATVVNHNRLLSLYADCVGLKTGFTKQAGRCLVSAATRDGVTLIAVTLNAPNDWNDHRQLLDAGFEAVQTTKAPSADWPPIAVAGGTTETVQIKVDTLPTLLWFSATEQPAVEQTVEAPPFVWAPVTAGQTVGRVIYTINGQTVGTADVVATESVSARPRASFGARFRRAFVSLWKHLI